MTTSEKTVKTAINRVLSTENVYFFCPVQMGYGAAGLDYHCVVVSKNGMPIPFFIEAKKPGETPRPRQVELIKRLIEEYKCKTWIIDSDIGVEVLKLWLQNVKGK